MQHRPKSVALGAAMLAVVFAATPVHAVGYWNLPGNAGQWWGYGWGAGHHACFVLGPVSHKGTFAHNQVRLPHAPQPAYGCYGECAYNYDFRQPPHRAPDEYQPQFVAPPPALSPAPSSQTLNPDALPMPQAPPPPEAIFPAPVER